MTEDELSQLIGHIAFHPEGGDVIQGTNGVRKLRWDRPGMGKSGGLRVIYFYYDLNMPLYLLTVYSKNKTGNISNADKKDMQMLTRELVRYWHRRRINKTG